MHIPLEVGKEVKFFYLFQLKVLRMLQMIERLMDVLEASHHILTFSLRSSSLRASHCPASDQIYISAMILHLPPDSY